MKIKRLVQRILLITVFSAITMVLSYGQAALLVLILGDKVATEKFHLSIDGALNLASFQNPEQGKYNLGVNFGLGTHLKLSERWFLQTDFKPLSQKGVSSVNPIVTIPPEIEAEKTGINLNYIDVPVMIQYKIGTKLFISAGPQISFLTSASQYTEGTLDGNIVSIKRDTQSQFEKIDISFPLELRYSLSLSRKKASTQVDVDTFVRYSFGFMDVYKDPAVGSAHIATFQFGLSFPFIKSAEELEKGKNK
jgi:hypothetical protein